ncbi:Early nodulin-like protein 2 [Cardamine amara subsp. amara]|uniref:Early nodulin-like protein 2 n=1 Tax=Cardamine amara subsp. amara TaxID=228776 RepID=A0ABD1AAF1_CARAN
MKSLFLFFTILISFSTLFTISDARKFNVGGSGAWVPNPPENYDSWAGKSRFRVHDTLYFSYAKGSDSVLEVNKADFDGCNTMNPIKRMDDGASEVSLDRSGPFYFISGNEDNCKKGQKLAVVVLSVRSPSTAQPPHAAAPGNSPPGSMAPPVSPVTTPPGTMPPKSSSPGSPTTSPPGSMAPKSSSPVSPTTSPPAPPKSSTPVSPSSAPMTSPPAPMAPKSSSPVTTPSGARSPKSSSPVSNSPALSPSLAPAESPSSASSSPSDSPSANSPSGSGMGPSGGGPSAAGDITTPGGAPGQPKASANGMAVMLVTTVLSLVLTIFLLA